MRTSGGGKIQTGQPAAGLAVARVVPGQIWALRESHCRTAFKLSTFTVLSVDSQYATVMKLEVLFPGSTGIGQVALLLACQNAWDLKKQLRLELKAERAASFKAWRANA